VDIEGDIDKLIRTDEFGVDAIYVDPDGVRRAIRVIFDRSYQNTDVNGANVANVNTQATAKTSDVPNVNSTALLIIDGVTYKIYEGAFDGWGLTILSLTKD